MNEESNKNTKQIKPDIFNLIVHNATKKIAKIKQ